MPPTLTTAPDPAVFPADVRAFAAERGVTGYLTPLYELTRQCFPGAEVAVTQQNDYEVAGLGWVVYEVAVRDWSLDRYRAAKARWIGEFLRSVPPQDRAPFILGMR
jgi:hypothetical protein